MLRLRSRARSPLLALLLAALLAAGPLFGVAPVGAEESPEQSGDAAAADPRVLDLPAGATSSSVAARFGGFWEENRGQYGHEALWVLRGAQTAALTQSGLVLAREGQDPVRMRFVDGQGTQVHVVEALPSTTSIVGGGLEIEGARHAQRLRMPDVWPGIDFDVYLSAAGNLEYDFRVHPGADPAQARLVVEGADPSLAEGHLVLDRFRFAPPYSFQAGDEVASWFVIDGQQVRIDVAAYDQDRLLVMDPELLYGTLVATDASSASEGVYASTSVATGVYFAGTMYQPYYGSVFHPNTQAIGTHVAYRQGYFVHLAPDHTLRSFVELRSEYQYGDVYVNDMDVDEHGRVYLTGTTRYEGIPIVGGYTPAGSYIDAFAARFVPIGGNPLQYTLDFSTMLTTNSAYYSWGLGIDVNPDGTFWFSGMTVVDEIQQGPSTFKHGNMGGGYNYNVFGTLWKSGMSPQHLMTVIAGGTAYDYVSRFDNDSEGNLYFVGSTESKMSSPLPTTADALFPTPIGGNDHFYGKIGRDGSLGHLSYWGSPASDPIYSGSGTTPGMAIDVIGVDEIVIAGTAANCCVPLSSTRLQPGRSGGYDAFVSHIRLADQEIVFSTHVGGTGSDYGQGVAYDDATGTYYVGGEAYRSTILPEGPWAEPMPKPGRNANYDTFVAAINPGAYDPDLPADSQEPMMLWNMYLGGDHAGTGRSHMRHLTLTDDRFLQVSGTQYSAAVGTQAPTTATAMDPVAVRANNYDGFFQRFPILGSFTINTTDGDRSATTPPERSFQTLTRNPVHFEAELDESIDWATPDDLLWDLDGDGTFHDATGAGPHVVQRDVQQTVKVCGRLMPPFAGSLPLDQCIEVFWENRPPVPLLRLLDEPRSYGDPLPQFYRGDQIWVDGSSSFDLDGDIVIESIVWDAMEAGDPPGTWQLDEDVLLGSREGLALAATYNEVGRKRISLTLTDAFNATNTRSLGLEIVNQPPTLVCQLAEAARAGRWLDIDVIQAADPDGTIKEWSLDPGQGLDLVTGTGSPPARIRTRSLVSEGPGTAVLSLEDADGATARCTLPYEAMPADLVADFTWNGTPVAGRPHEFQEVSTTSGRPVLAWEWRIDGALVSTEQHPKLNFAHAGTALVTLRVTDGLVTDTYSRPLDVAPASPGPRAQIGVPSGPFTSGHDIRLEDISIPGAAPLVKRSWTIPGQIVAEDAAILIRLPPGEHDVTLRVTDADGIHSERTVRLAIEAVAEVVPEFTASNIEPRVGEQVVFSDVSRTGALAIVDREWSFGDASRAAHGSLVRHTFWQPGTYEVTLTLYDQEGQRHHVRHAITVQPPGEGQEPGPSGYDPVLPVADAGVDRRVLEGTVVVVDSAASRSAQSAGLVATWAQKDGPEVALVPRGNDVSFRVPYAAGEAVTLELVVMDIHGASEPDTVRLHIVDAHADALGLVAAPEASFEVEGNGRIVRLTAPEHDVQAEYEWQLGDGTTAKGAAVVHEYTHLGTYPVRLVVRDIHGQESETVQHLAVRSHEDQTPDVAQQSSKTTLFGYELRALLIAGLVVAAAATVAAIVVRRR